MTPPVEFWVTGQPKGQPRPRAFARKIGNSFVARVYDAHTAEGWKSCIAVAARPHLTAFDGPVAVTANFHFQRPKCHLRKDGTQKPSAPFSYVSKPDCDNLAKALLDALTQLGFWHDDAQVVQLVTRKSYCVDSATPGVWVQIKESDL